MSGLGRLLTARTWEETAVNPLLNLHFDVRDELLDATLDCEESVFLESFGNTRNQLEEEYGPYNDQSLFIAVSDDSGLVVGACRIIRPGSQGLKTLNDVGRQPWGVDGMRSARAAGIDIDRTWDIATIGVRRQYRGPRLMVAMAMYHAIMRSTRINDVATATAILDSAAFQVLADAGYLFTTLPGTAPAPYLGSESSIPVYGHWTGLADAQRRMFPELYRLITLGIGIDGVAIPDDEAFDLQRKPILVAVASDGNGKEAAA
jgi:hypothetical protein